MARPVLRTPLCDLLGIEYPVLLAGMGSGDGPGVAGAELAAAVSEAGGLGVLGAIGLTPDQIHEECARIRSLTKKPFGVDTLLPGNTARADIGDGDAFEALPQEYKDWTERVIADFGLQHPDEAITRGSGVGWGDAERQEAQMQAIIEEKVPVFAAGLGNPQPYLKDLHANGTVVIALVGNVKNALRVNQGGADVIVAQGHEAGGHTGRVGAFALTPQVVDAVRPTPVVHAGGVGDGRGVAAALALGAQGVWVGSAFIATPEANTRPEHKQRMIDASEEDTRITKLFSGKTMRNLYSPLVRHWDESGLEPLPMGQQGIVSARVQAALRASGRMDLLSAPTGQITGMVRQVRPARDVLDQMVREAVEVLADLTARRVTIAIET